MRHQGQGQKPLPHPYKGVQFKMSQTYWWAWEIHQGRPVVRGPYGDNQEATRRGFETLGADFEVVELQTRDVQKAKGIIRNLILQKTKSLDLALSRFKDKPDKIAGQKRS